VAPVAPGTPVAPVGPVAPVAPFVPIVPAVPGFPATAKTHSENVPCPLLESSATVMLTFCTRAEIIPSI
jgi:hypothetical protein